VDRRFLKPPGKPLRSKVASGFGVALERYQDMRQGAGEKLGIKEVVSFLKSPVFGLRDFVSFAFASYDTTAFWLEACFMTAAP
jgi:hypothetical protein